MISRKCKIVLCFSPDVNAVGGQCDSMEGEDNVIRWKGRTMSFDGRGGQCHSMEEYASSSIKSISGFVIQDIVNRHLQNIK